jgi:hypothetical protein
MKREESSLDQCELDSDDLEPEGTGFVGRARALFVLLLLTSFLALALWAFGARPVLGDSTLHTRTVENVSER